MKTKSVNPKETIMQWVFTVCACVSILAVALICLFLFANGLPTIAKIGPLQFLLGTNWKTRQRPVRHSADDSWQHLRYGRRD